MMPDAKVGRWEYFVLFDDEKPKYFDCDLPYLDDEIELAGIIKGSGVAVIPPNQANELKLKKHHGRAEALLLAEYLRRKLSVNAA